MTQSSENIFKKNIADINKIPPNEFEKYFQEWMERDDVARSLQAKLRCDLIKNFNKTNLGKHILSHTMTSTGGSTMRLTLSPLVLALNTLVAEFLYAQNCHFTLSVFCTEVPYRNTLPDFESMRQYRFNDTEIVEIWEAVTGRKAIKNDLHKHVIKNYESNPNMSLLLLIIKYLLKKDPCVQVNRNVEVQTDIQEKYNKSTLIQANEPENKLPPQDENLHHINKYLLTLSKKLCEMTKEFEELAKQKHVSRSHTLKSARSRDYYALNKSLERITENMKIMAQAKRKNKRLTNIVASIDRLTKEFGKCAENFKNITTVFSHKEDKACSAKVKFKEQQTETEIQPKSYADWINEMRNTTNGQKFLNRVEISLRKILTKHREQIKQETEIKLKHLKSLMKLHYQQKLSKHLLQDPKLNIEEIRKCNDNIEKKLQRIELKQIESLQKLQESSMELREAEQKPKENSMEKKNCSENDKLIEKSSEIQHKEIITQTQEEDYISTLRKLQISVDSIKRDQRKEADNSKLKTKPHIETASQVVTDTEMPVKATPFSKPLLEDAQKQFMDMAKTITEQSRSADKIIFDAKLRVQQLENESNHLDQIFQSYLERRKLDQDQELNAQYTEVSSNKSKENLSLTPLLDKAISLAQLDKLESLNIQDEIDDEIDEEFRRMKENLRLDEEDKNVPKSSKSDSSTSSLEIRNAILEAKLKFFEHEHTIRQCKEQDEQIRSGNLLQKQFEKYSELNEISEYFNKNFGENNSETNVNLRALKDKKENREFISENKTPDGQYELEESPLKENNTQPKTEEKSVKSARKELFAQKAPQITEEPAIFESTTAALDVKHKVRYHEPIAMHSKNLKAALKGQLHLPETEQTKSVVQVENTTELIKQSMAKMQQLFEKQAQSKESLREMVNDIDKQREINKSNWQNVPKPLILSASTTLPSTTTNTTITTNHSSDNIMANISNFNQISDTSMPSILNLTSESEEGFSSANREMEITADTIIDMEKPKEIDKETISTVPTEGTSNEQEWDQINETSDSSELNLLPSPSKKMTQTTSHKILQEFEEIIDSPNLADLHLSEPDNDKEIGEIFSASNKSFVSIETKLDESNSTHSSLELSTGKQDGKEINDSESDFWA